MIKGVFTETTGRNWRQLRLRSMPKRPDVIFMESVLELLGFGSVSLLE